MMDSEIPNDNVSSSQYAFVKNDLIAASQNPTIKWIIVCFHTPMYTSPSKHLPDILLRNIYHPLFDQYGVDLVLQAHNHNYQRSYPIEYNSLSQEHDENNPPTTIPCTDITNTGTEINPNVIQDNNPPTITSADTNIYNDPTGEIYVIAGTAGRSLHPLCGQAPFMVTQYYGYGFLDVDITNDNSGWTKLTGTFYANSHGSVIDTFSITK
jgi:hypothetical protein